MRRFELTGIQADRPTVLLLAGGGQEPYNKFHKVTKLFQKYDCNIISVELPGHGKSGFDRIISDEELINSFLDEFQEIVEQYKEVALFGFSLGALLSLKAVEHKLTSFKFVITTGAGLKISKNEEEVMQHYASIEFFEQMRWLRHMKRYHGESWKYLLESLSPMLRVGSNLFIDTTNFNPEVPLHLIVGDSDDVVDDELQQEFTDHDCINLHILPNTKHFEYFTSSWDVMQDSCHKIISKYFDRL